MGVKGASPLGCLPHWGRVGVTLAISTPAQKTRKGLPMKIELFSYERDFFEPSSIYDDCRRPRRVAPAADQLQTIQKNPCPPCLREALRRGSIVYITIFKVWVRTLCSCLFLQSQIFIIFYLCKKENIRVTSSTAARSRCCFLQCPG